MVTLELYAKKYEKIPKYGFKRNTIISKPRYIFNPNFGMTSLKTASDFCDSFVILSPEQTEK